MALNNAQLRTSKATTDLTQARTRSEAPVCPSSFKDVKFKYRVLQDLVVNTTRAQALEANPLIEAMFHRLSVPANLTIRRTNYSRNICVICDM